jgi:SAM-dependent methyltransferase
MDYRKPAVFGQNWSESRYKVLPYFAIEKSLATRGEITRILEIGCGNGWNMSRFSQYGHRMIGVDTVTERVLLAQTHGPALLADGRSLPFANNSLDMIYIQHVLHHIGHIDRALAEVWRCLRPDGILFLVETVEDNPFIRWGRRLYPRWLGDEINVAFTFSELATLVAGAGFRTVEAGQYSVLFWLWEILPDQLPIMENLTPLAVTVEQLLQRIGRQYSAHCYLVARKEVFNLRSPSTP